MFKHFMYNSLIKNTYFNDMLVVVVVIVVAMNVDALWVINFFYLQFLLLVGLFNRLLLASNRSSRVFLY